MISKWLTVLALLISTACSDFGSDPITAIAPIQFNTGTICTAWHYSPFVYITAAHCTTNPDQEYLSTVTIGGVAGTVIKRDLVADLAAIIVLHRPRQSQLTISPYTSSVGQSVRGLGFGGGSETAYYTFGHISSLDMVFPTARTGQNLILYGGFIPGMSGGPIINSRGYVISVIVGSGPPHGIFHNIGVGTAPGVLERFVRDLP